jgi:hypothetical protein
MRRKKELVGETRGTLPHGGDPSLFSGPPTLFLHRKLLTGHLGTMRAGPGGEVALAGAAPLFADRSGSSVCQAGEGSSLSFPPLKKELFLPPCQGPSKRSQYGHW